MTIHQLQSLVQKTRLQFKNSILLKLESMSYDDLSKLTGLKKNQIHKIVHEKGQPKFETVIKVLIKLNGE